MIREPQGMVARGCGHHAALTLRRTQPEQAIAGAPLLEAARHLLILVFEQQLDAARRAQPRGIEQGCLAHVSAQTLLGSFDALRTHHARAYP
jgi:hypothetical protein